MEPANRVLVLRARNEPFEQVPYVIHLLMDEWRRRGIDVAVTDSLAEPTGPDVLVFPHMDLTVIPPPLAERLSRCARAINRSVTDISKRRISRHLVAATDDYDGPVIVKTNLNFGGKPEIRLVALAGGEPLQKLEDISKLPWTVSGMLQPENYPIYKNPGLVPPRVWDNPRLIVEKFLPEREGEFYCLRQYIFFGESEINTRSISPNPRVKSRRVLRREILDSTPRGVRAVRDELGFDYGKFDYVMRDGEAIVFDANRTFSYDPMSKTGSASSMVMKLAEGIQPFLDGE
jgi:hypothetical protein